MRALFNAVPQYQPLLRQIGLDSDAVFADPRVKVWRSTGDRENATLNVTLSDGRDFRLHIKRYHPVKRGPSPADLEVRGIELLRKYDIPTVPLVCFGRLADGRSFTVTEDLAGYTAADKLIAAGLPFDRLLEPTADLAARLHRAGLHHRDLYLCHFFACVAAGGGIDLKLIDPARVRPLPSWPTRRRWIVKDLAQFWYSTQSLSVTDAQRDQWLDQYERRCPITDLPRLRLSIARKCASIARHDQRLRSTQPGRNISIPH